MEIPCSITSVGSQIYADRFNSHGFYVQDMLAWGEGLTFLAGLRYRLSQQATLTANVKNLFDRMWYANAINTTSIGVGAPRTLFVGVEWKI